jgi:hypothetical protein
VICRYSFHCINQCRPLALVPRIGPWLSLFWGQWLISSPPCCAGTAEAHSCEFQKHINMKDTACLAHFISSSDQPRALVTSAANLCLYSAVGTCGLSQTNIDRQN